jgi:hypothetical protein
MRRTVWRDVMCCHFGNGRVANLKPQAKEAQARLDSAGATLDDATERVALLAEQPTTCLSYLLETQPNISVFQLYISVKCRGCTSLPWSPTVVVKDKV